LADDGTVFSFGSNLGGQTGQGTIVGDTFIPTPIDSSNLKGKAIVQVVAGEGQSLLLADDGTVFSFGVNNRLGLGSVSGVTDIATEIPPSSFSGRTIVQLATGDFFSLFLASDGTVFSCGDNSLGRTGQGINDGDTLVPTPIDVSNLRGLTVEAIFAGGNHSILLAAPSVSEPSTFALILPSSLLFITAFRRKPSIRFAMRRRDHR
jgi:alpha-tubulin suppressor-like RCC1 family protein